MALSKIWVLAEATDGKVTTSTLELLTKARSLADTVEVVYAGGDADVITLSGGINTVQGNSGADSITATGGSNVIEGGADNDTISFTAAMTLIGTDIAAIKNVENLEFSNAGANSITLTDAFFTNGAITTIAIKDASAAGALTVNASALTAANSVNVTANVATGVDDTLVGGAGNDMRSLKVCFVS